METFRNHETQWSDGICKRLQAGYTKSNEFRSKIISGFWIYLAVFVTAIYMSSCSADIGELEKEVKKTMVDTMREKGQNLTITKLSLVHQGGNNYEGLASGTIDGEKIELDVYVVYDGASFKAEWQPTAEYVQKENNRIYEEQQREYERMMKENQKQQEKALREVEEAERELEMQMNTNDWN